MSTIAAMIAGAGIFASGGLVGSWITNARIALQRKRSLPTCSCDHVASLHSPETGECHAEIEHDKYDTIGRHIGIDYVQCKCKRYDGPIPVERYLGQRLTLPPDAEQ